MIFDAYEGIANYTELDVACENCGEVSTIPRPDNSKCHRLIEGYYFHSSIAELELLKRAQKLFDSRPLSNHRHIIRKTYREPVNNPEDSSLLQKAIDADPHLKEFLEMCDFSFHPRKQSIEKSINNSRKILASNTTPCPHCGGALRLTEESHDACGGVFFSEKARLRWIARHKDCSRKVS